MLMSFLELMKRDIDQAKAYDLAMKQEALKRQTDERNAMGLKALQLCADAKQQAVINMRMRGIYGFTRVVFIKEYHFAKRALMRAERMKS